MSLLLEELLDRARDALLNGDLAQLSALAPEVEAASDALPALPMPVARRLRQKADRNAALLQAAARGLRAAEERLGQIRSGPTLATYDARGRKAVLGDGAPAALGRF